MGESPREGQGQGQGQKRGRFYEYEEAGFQMAETMTYQSELIRPPTDESGEDFGGDGPRGQVMAAEDDDDMEWLDIEKIQDPRGCGVPVPGIGNGFRSQIVGKLELQSMGRSFPNVIKSHEYKPEESRVQSRSPRRNATQTALSGRSCQLPSRMPVLHSVQRHGG